MRHLAKDEDVSITLFQGMEGLASIRTAWDQIVLGMDHRHFFHLWEWYHSYTMCLAPDPNDLLFLLFTRRKNPIAILPLQCTQISFGHLKLKALAFPSHDHLLLCDLIGHRDALSLPLFQLLGDYLRNQGRSWDVIQLSHLLENACAVQVIHNRPPARFLFKEEGRCDYLDTTGTYESFLAGLPKKFKGSLKRARQSLDELPEVRVAFTQNGPDLEEKLNSFMDVEASGWKGALGSGTAIKLNTGLKCFYQELARTLSTTGRVSINTLTADGKCIAAQFCLLVDHTAYLLKLGYDEDYKRYAPGNLLVELLLKKSTEDRTIENINLIADAEWLALWRAKSYNKFKLYLFNTTPVGLIGFIILKSYPFLKKRYQSYIKPHLSKRMQEWIERRSHET